MEITATSKYDLKTVTALVHASVFKKHNPKKRIILCAVLTGFLIAIFIFLTLVSDDILPIIMLCLCALLILMMCYAYLLLPRNQYRAMGKFAESHNIFKFTDDTVIMSSSVDGYSGSCSVAYRMFYQVMETGEYLFLYENKTHAFIVDKSTVQGGTVGELRAKFTNVPGLKYVMCYY